VPAALVVAASPAKLPAPVWWSGAWSAISPRRDIGVRRAHAQCATATNQCYVTAMPVRRRYALRMRYERRASHASVMLFVVFTEEQRRDAVRWCQQIMMMSL